MDIQEKIRNEYSVTKDFEVGEARDVIAPARPRIVTPDGAGILTPADLHEQQAINEQQIKS